VRFAFVLVLSALAGCASASRDCGQLAHERWQIQPRLDEVQRRLKLGGSRELEAEYAQLNDEIDAIRRAATAGNCAD
jgi:hypothetical protein